MGMLSSPLRRNIAGCSLEDFQKGLLNSLTRDIAGNGDVVGLAPYLVDFVDVDDADLGLLDVVVGVLKQAKDDVLHILPDISGLRQRGGVGDTERDVENTGQRSGQKGLARSRGTHEQDIALLHLHVSQPISKQSCRHSLALESNALVVIVNGYRKSALGQILTDDMGVEFGPDLGRFGDAQ